VSGHSETRNFANISVRRVAFIKLSRDYFDFIDKMDIQANLALLDGDDEEAAN
jgi:hypothetical protein